MSFEFSPAGYRGMIAALRERGYEARNYADADPSAKHLIVRHDVDFSLDAALAMAEQEHALALPAVYFVLLRTEFYNPLSGAGLAALRRIAELGHVIGLHFDAALYSGDAAALDSAVAKECALLEAAIERPVTLMSFHRPAKERIGESDRLGGRINAYARRFVEDMGYCSDSRGAWNYGVPLDHPAVREGRALHLLTHPFWWQEPQLAPADRLRRFIEQRRDQLDQELARHCDVHRAGR